jgi:hypothetical protein
LLPLLVADQGDAIDGVAARRGELDVVPQCVRAPAVEVLEQGQQPYLVLFGDRGVDQRHERPIVLVVQLAGQLEGSTFCDGAGGSSILVELSPTRTNR